MPSFKGFVKKAARAADSVICSGATVVRTFSQSDEPVRVNTPGSIRFRYVGTDEKADYEGVTFYTDDYFSRPATEYDQKLGTSSLALAMACGNSHQGYTRGYVNAEALLRDMGFSDVHHNEAYENITTMETIGVVLGIRRLPDCTLVCMGLRGIGYGSEWGANMLLGTGDYHQGFDEASDRALGCLREYLTEHGVTGRVKLWVTGYSRSASTANLVAGKIDIAVAEGVGEGFLAPGVTVDVSGVYAYCFEPAETVVAAPFQLHGPVFSNIWNHVNPCDPVPVLVTKCFGMERFGTDLLFPCPLDSNYPGRRDRMLSFYNRLANRDEIGHYRIDFFTAVDVEALNGSSRRLQFADQSEFIEDVNSRFFDSLGSRDFYVDRIQKGLSNIIADNNTLASSSRFREEFKTALGDDKLAVVAALLALEKDDFDGVRNSLSSPVSVALREAGLTSVTEYEMSTAITETLFLFKDFIRSNKLLCFNLLFNSKTVFSAHYPELAFAWMMSMDPRYVL